MVDPAKMRAKLEARLVELGARLEHIEEDLDAPMPKDSEERASEREGDEVLEHLGLQGQAEIRAIKEALRRIEHGEYGACRECGDEISAARLDAVPHATHCRKCA
ncbi:MAG: TraR/DksA C4-type zinc finger protein [Pseudomonadota bacterium]